jgi:hypothetical protein
MACRLTFHRRLSKSVMQFNIGPALDRFRQVAGCIASLLARTAIVRVNFNTR